MLVNLIYFSFSNIPNLKISALILQNNGKKKKEKDLEGAIGRQIVRTGRNWTKKQNEKETKQKRQREMLRRKEKETEMNEKRADARITEKQWK